MERMAALWSRCTSAWRARFLTCLVLAKVDSWTVCGTAGGLTPERVRTIRIPGALRNGNPAKLLPGLPFRPAAMARGPEGRYHDGHVNALFPRTPRLHVPRALQGHLACRWHDPHIRHPGFRPGH